MESEPSKLRAATDVYVICWLVGGACESHSSPVAYVDSYKQLGPPYRVPSDTRSAHDGARSATYYRARAYAGGGAYTHHKIRGSVAPRFWAVASGDGVAHPTDPSQGTQFGGYPCARSEREVARAARRENKSQDSRRLQSVGFIEPFGSVSWTRDTETDGLSRDRQSTALKRNAEERERDHRAENHDHIVRESRVS